jgi:hypothetical protein
MSFRFEQTKLWRATLAEQPDDLHKRERERLRNAFYSFRDKTSVLVGRIAVALPGLTQHEISHLDALWETATLIAGDNYPINPLEGFIFGGAILLHDSALSFEAYSGGISGIRSTVVWKDAYSAECAANSGASEEQNKSNADFAALRSLHAIEAAKLIERSWPDPDTQEPIFLIEDSTLRKHLGPLIGKIASSHHWDIELVGAEFSNQINAIPLFPREWRIDPLKLACLLRCADAAHIDHERAPDFLHALLRRKGISFAHWQAQNRIARADIDMSDQSQSTIVFTSTRAFPVSDSASWWVTYDAACLIDREIRASNALLEEQRPSALFKIKRVKGIESPERLSQSIKTEGWQPCSAMLHVSNVEKLISELGGEVLYGAGTDQFGIALRELIQNARDAIHARRNFDPHFEGSVRVRLQRNSDSIKLLVEDDGIGMSRRVLTGPLLDFGSSFWASSLVKEEFPGLRSSKFQSIGRFGIGFYSVFMIATEVCVASRRWDQGQNEVTQLIFENGVSLRPLLISGRPADLPSDICTRITLGVKKGILSEDGKLEVKRNVMNGTNFFVEVADYIAALCAGLDVKINYEDDKGCKAEIHSGHPMNPQNHASWLRRLSFACFQNPSVGKYIDENHHRLRPISEDGKCFGLAAISVRRSNDQEFLSVATVGGLATSVHHRGPSDYIGYIDYKPKSAKRDQDGYAASESTMQAWVKDQFELLMQSKLNPLEQTAAAASLANFNFDPTPILRVCVGFDAQVAFLSLTELIRLMERMDVAFLKPRIMECADVHNDIYFMPNRALIRPLQGGSLYNLSMVEGIPKKDCSVASCIHRALLQQGKSPRWNIEKDVARSVVFGALDAVVVTVKPA